ncbi:MAG: nitronate monooxygenase, partial [Cyanobacteria bacterium]|nr:nitronate monooxygenase [Cyanobacteriota bacterium]
MTEPILIQGGMGVGVSNWCLARAVSRLGHLGVVSGTALDTVVARRLQDGDPGGHLLRAIEHFPIPEISDEVVAHYFVPEGRGADKPYRSVPMHNLHTCSLTVNLTIVANFAEVYLAKEDHDGIVGINYLEKIQTPLLPSLFGAMLAGVDYVLMGAGIPKAVPGILDKLAKLQPVSMKLAVDGAKSEDLFDVTFDPVHYIPKGTSVLKRPKFIAIVSSHVLASTLAKKSSGRIDGFVVE